MKWCDMPLLQFWIHSDPADISSLVDIKITMNLTKEVQNENSIGWKITSVKFDYLMTLERKTWTVLNPSVPSPDKRWWVNHLNPEEPLLEEFSNPPRMTGSAHADNSSGADLIYYFEGRGLSKNNPWAISPLLHYSFMELGRPEPFYAGHGEPVELPASPLS
ncbi:MAG: hypothetical protein AB7N71_11440 [Phycisphaerae bacterium]